MVDRLVKLLLRVMIAIGELDAGIAYTRQEIIEAAENFCRDYPEADDG